MKKIVLTGGGTAGHVVPNLALVPNLHAEGFEVHYIGSRSGIEAELATKSGLPYYGISVGKLRRYFDARNFTDLFRIVKGFFEALVILRRLKPCVVFSKGGFVVVGVVYAAWLLKIKIVIHESDLTPGLATRLVMPFASKVCCTFPETMKRVPSSKAALTGLPLRHGLHDGCRNKGLEAVGFGDEGNPVLLVMGGSQGSVKINTFVRECLHDIIRSFRVIHLCGKGNLSGIQLDGYAEFEYVQEDIAHVLAAADFVLSRAGASSLFELIALQKPNILIPLSTGASRGDQIQNASSAESQDFSIVLLEENLTKEALLDALSTLQKNSGSYIAAMESQNKRDATKEVVQVILQATETQM